MENLRVQEITTIEQPPTLLNQSQTVTQTLDKLFPEQKRAEKKVRAVKDILGTLFDQLSASEIQDVIAETEYLVESWLDDYERQIFKGITLNELLHEKGGL